MRVVLRQTGNPSCGCQPPTSQKWRTPTWRVRREIIPGCLTASVARERPRVDSASTSVFFDGAGAARMGDPAKTCNDPTDAPNGVVIAPGSVVVG